MAKWAAQEETTIQIAAVLSSLVDATLAIQPPDPDALHYLLKTIALVEVRNLRMIPFSPTDLQLAFVSL